MPFVGIRRIPDMRNAFSMKPIVNNGLRNRIAPMPILRHSAYATIHMLTIRAVRNIPRSTNRIAPRTEQPNGGLYNPVPYLPFCRHSLQYIYFRSNCIDYIRLIIHASPPRGAYLRTIFIFTLKFLSTGSISTIMTTYVFSGKALIIYYCRT